MKKFSKRLRRNVIIFILTLCLIQTGPSGLINSKGFVGELQMGALTVEAKYMHLCVDLNPVILPPYVRRALPIFLCKKGDQLSITLKTTGYVECGFYCMNTDSAYGIPNKKGTFTFLMTVPSDGSYQFWVRNNEGKFINMQGAVYWTKCGAGWKK